MPAKERIDQLAAAMPNARYLQPAGTKESLQTVLACGKGTDEAIVLIKARTDTKYFQALGDFFNDGRMAICFVRGRIKYPEHKSASGMPSAIIYFGQNAKQFESIFQEVANYIYMPGIWWVHSSPR